MEASHDVQAIRAQATRIPCFHPRVRGWTPSGGAGGRFRLRARGNRRHRAQTPGEPAANAAGGQCVLGREPRAAGNPEHRGAEQGGPRHRGAGGQRRGRRRQHLHSRRRATQHRAEPRLGGRRLSRRCVHFPFRRRAARHERRGLGAGAARTAGHAVRQEHHRWRAADRDEPPRAGVRGQGQRDRGQLRPARRQPGGQRAAGGRDALHAALADVDRARRLHRQQDPRHGIQRRRPPQRHLAVALAARRKPHRRSQSQLRRDRAAPARPAVPAVLGQLRRGLARRRCRTASSNRPTAASHWRTSAWIRRVPARTRRSRTSAAVTGPTTPVPR